jgi:predicted RND superfamily exporter protein
MEKKGEEEKLPEPTEERKLPGDIVAKPLGKLVSGCFKHGKLVITIVVILTIFFAIGIFPIGKKPGLKFSTDITTILPTRDPNTKAMKRLLEKTTGLESVEIVITKLDPEKAQYYGVTNITDPIGIRAQDELWRYVKERVPEVGEMNGLLAHIYSYLNYANHAGEDLSWYKLPESDAELKVIGTAAWAIVGQITAQLTPYLTGPGGEFDWFIMSIGYAPAEKEPGEVISLKQVEVGHRIEKALEEYVKDCESGSGEIKYDIFDHEWLLRPVGVGTALYHVTETSIWSAEYLGPIIIVFILIALYLAFRNIHTIFIALINLLITFVWTLGLLSWLGWEISVFSLAIFPLVLGNGIDYSIHILNEYFEHRTRGFTDGESFKKTGSKAGVAMLLATLDTNVGLIAMSLCGMIALAQLGWSAAFAMTSVLVLAWTFIPALTSISKGARKAAVKFKPSKVMPAAARLVSKHKALTLVAFVIVSCVLFTNLANLEYMTDPITDLYPPEDPLMKVYKFAMGKVAPKMGRPTDTITIEVGILEGDLTNPACVNYSYKLEDALRKNPRSISALTIGVLNPYWYIGLYEAEKYGNIGTLLGLGQSIIPGYPIEGLCPDTREGIEGDLEEIKADPLWNEWLRMFIGEDDSIAFLPIIYLAGYGWDESRALKSEIYKAIDEVEEDKPEGVNIYLEGLRTSTYNFLAITSAWSWILFLAALACSLICIAFFTRKGRAVLALALPMVFSTMWWLGIVPFFGIKINPGLIIPIIFITSIAPDYADHLIWNSYKTGDVEYTFSTTGKAILFSAITDFGAFFIFTFAYIKAFVAQPMAATSICIAIMFFLVLMLIPTILTKKEVEIKKEKK